LIVVVTMETETNNH